MATYLSPHFTLEELTRSKKAKLLGVDNTPSPEHLENLRMLANEYLEPIRIAWGSAIKVTSGYRGFQYGSSTSVHPEGLAADIIPANGKIAKFKKYVRDWLHTSKKPYDQYIDEADLSGSEWVHLGAKNKAGQQRGQDLITKDSKNYRKLPAWKAAKS